MPIVPKLEKKIRIIYILNGQEWLDYVVKKRTPNASTMYRLLNPMVMLNASEEVECLMSDTVMIENETKLAPLVQDADIVVMPRIQVIYPEQLKKFIKLCEDAGKLICFEHDDWYWDQPESSYRRSEMTQESLDLTLYLARHAHLITSPNAFLNENTVRKAKATPLHTAAIPNALFTKEWHQMRFDNRKMSSQVTICLSGATNHYPDFKWIMPTLRRIHKKYGTRVCFKVLGFKKGSYLKTDNYEAQKKFQKDLAILEKEFNSIGAATFMSIDFLQYPRRMCELSPDIGIIVTGSEIYDQCKSTLKFAEFTAAGATCVCKREKPYTLELDDQVVAYADTEEEYFKQLCYLIENTKERREMWNRAKWLLEKRYDIHTTAALWLDAFKTVYQKSLTKSSRVPATVSR